MEAIKCVHVHMSPVTVYVNLCDSEQLFMLVFLSVGMSLLLCRTKLQIGSSEACIHVFEVLLWIKLCFLGSETKGLATAIAIICFCSVSSENLQRDWDI